MMLIKLERDTHTTYLILVNFLERDVIEWDITLNENSACLAANLDN